MLLVCSNFDTSWEQQQVISRYLQRLTSYMKLFDCTLRMFLAFNTLQKDVLLYRCRFSDIPGGVKSGLDIYFASPWTCTNSFKYFVFGLHYQYLHSVLKAKCRKGSQIWAWHLFWFTIYKISLKVMTFALPHHRPAQILQVLCIDWGHRDQHRSTMSMKNGILSHTLKEFFIPAENPLWF